MSSSIRVIEKEKVSREIRENKIAVVCEKRQGLRSGNFSDLNSACSKVLVPVKIFQFHHMHYESERYRDAANGLHVKNYFNSNLNNYMRKISNLIFDEIHYTKWSGRRRRLTCDLNICAVSLCRYLYI